MDRLRAAGALALALSAAPLTAAGAPQTLAAPPAVARPAAAPAAFEISPDAAPGPEGPVHRVRPGECLSVIAQRYGVGVAALARANGIANPDFIQAGRLLRVPRAAGTAGAAAHPAGASRPGTDSPAARPDPKPAEAEPAAVAAMGTSAATGTGAAVAAVGTSAAATGTGAAVRAVGASAAVTGMTEPAAIAAMAGTDLHVYYAANRPARRPAPAVRRPRAPLRPAPLVAVEGVEEPMVALTFNGAPQARDLPAFLTVLERYRFRATFFIDPALAVGSPEVTEQLAAFGHEIGSYGLPPADWAGARWIRPPGGVWSREALAAAQRRGMVPALWSSIGLRDRPGTAPDHLAAQTAASLFPGAVLMLHADRPETAAALPGVLRSIYAAGYAARTLSEVVEVNRFAAPRVE